MSSLGSEGIRSTPPTQHPQTVPAPNRKQATEHIKAFGRIFSKSSQNEAQEVYNRMVLYAQECGMDAYEMVGRVEHGFSLAKRIADKNLKQAFPTQDLIDVDWFMRAQMAKMGKLYMKGAVKFPDPDNKFASFIMRTQSTFHGKVYTPKGRISSHWPEHQKNIQKTPIQLSDRSWVCFSNQSEKALKTAGVNVSKITNLKSPAICIDASGPKRRPKMGVAGENNATFLVMCFNLNSRDFYN